MTISTLIENFSVTNLKYFFREEIKTFKLDVENYEYLFDENEYITDNYKDIVKIGEADLTNTDDILVFTAKTLTPLTGKTGKKGQYEIAKKILKKENKDAAFFIFYDDGGNFRFSLIRVNFLGAKRDFTDFKRYTYFVSSKQTNKTFINQISKCDFNSLDSIQEAFSVEPITKQFYEKLQRWYFWAIKNVEFPRDAEQETNGREVAIIRLITRLMFIWFMKVRNLIPTDLFDEKNISKMLKDFSKEESTYYKAVLQNLFFATLNTEQKERKFRSEDRGAKGYNPDYGNHNVFRYQNLFSDSAILEKLFGNIPFLNGGLFECLDYKTKDKNERKYIDGFTATKEQQPKVPNFLFFSETEKVDISSFFGNENKTYEVEGLINLLNGYNFTIDENEPDDVEVALDPELLGSIFENLLASYNPETSTTARKATGSFYTPREIVNYMTNESLKQYFKTNLETSSNIDENLESLINAGNSENPFDEGTTKKIIDLINNLRVVDPAVGSGAFPMAMLNKLVFILGKLDLKNEYWKQSQIEGVKKSVSDSVVQRKLVEQIKRQFKEKNADYGRKLYLIEKCIYGVDIQQIAVEIAKLRFFISLLVDEKIDWDKPDSNYGIEPLPNLDFKLMQGNSLISTYAGIDFNDKKNENEAIKSQREEIKEQLNDIKIKQKEVQSEFIKILNAENRQDQKLKKELEKLSKTINKLENELKKIQNNKDSAVSEEHKKLIQEFEELKHQYQNEPDNETKKVLRDKIDKAIIKIFEEKISDNIQQVKNIEEKAKQFPKEEQREKYIAEEKQNLTKKLGFDIEQIEKDLTAYTEGRKPKDFFLWNVYFAEVFSQKAHPERTRREGFDIVIGNPPYIQISKLDEKLKKNLSKINFETFSSSGDIYELFYETGNKILAKGGHLCYITSNKWLRANYGTSTRKYFLAKTNPKLLFDFGQEMVFSSAIVHSSILLFQRDNFKNEFRGCQLSKSKLNSMVKYFRDNSIDLDYFNEEVWAISCPEMIEIKLKLEKVGVKLKKWNLSFYRGILTGYNDAFIINEDKKKELVLLNQKIRTIIKPILRGRDTRRYYCNYHNLYLVNTHNGDKKRGIKRIDVQYEFPELYSYLENFPKNIRTRADKGDHWTNLRNCAFLEEVEKEKIVFSEIVSEPQFYYDTQRYYPEATAFLITGENLKWLTALLNSELITVLFRIFYAGGELVGKYRYKKSFLEHLPIPEPIEFFNSQIEKLVDYISFYKGEYRDKSKEQPLSNYFESVVDGLVYEIVFPEELKAANKQILKNLGNLKPITDEMSSEKKLAIIQSEFQRLYDSNHLLRNNLETLDSIEEVRIIKDALK